MKAIAYPVGFTVLTAARTLQSLTQPALKKQGVAYSASRLDGRCEKASPIGTTDADMGTPVFPVSQ